MTSLRTDVLDDLRAGLQDDMRPGTSDSDVNTFDLDVTVKRGLLQKAINEIERLRCVAEAAQTIIHGQPVAGQSFRAIKQGIQNGTPIR